MPAQCCKDFLAKIADDVPIFTIVGYDALAPDVIRFWISKACSVGVNADKIIKAVEHLKAVEDYQKDNPDSVKIPD